MKTINLRGLRGDTKGEKLMGDNITIHFNFSNLTTLGNHLKTSRCWESEIKHTQNISKHILRQLFVPSSEWEALWEIVVV